jgi:superfamily I DNA and RNA helicase
MRGSAVACRCFTLVTNSRTEDRTIKFQKQVKEVVKKCSIIVDKSNKFKLIQIKPQVPKLNFLIKLHKDTTHIRPVVNYRNAPTYYIEKVMASWLKQNMGLSYKFNVDNTLECV